jgi:hypothetical protein
MLVLPERVKHRIRVHLHDGPDQPGQEVEDLMAFSCLRSLDLRHDEDRPEDLPDLLVLPERVPKGCLHHDIPGFFSRQIRRV